MFETFIVVAEDKGTSQQIVLEYGFAIDAIARAKRMQRDHTHDAIRVYRKQYSDDGATETTLQTITLS